MMHVLVIRSARSDVYRQCMSGISPDAAVTVLGTRLNDDVLAVGRLRIPTRIDTTPGPQSWNRLSPYARAALRNTRWSEIVILHNLGDESYDDVIGIASRAGAWRPLRVFYADGVEHRYGMVLSLVARRWALSLIASTILALVAAAAIGWAVALRPRRRAGAPTS
jgi:hypothetical protein